jgi:hypothetical protein
MEADRAIAHMIAQHAEQAYDDLMRQWAGPRRLRWHARARVRVFGDVFEVAVDADFDERTPQARIDSELEWAAMEEVAGRVAIGALSHAELEFFESWTDGAEADE